MTIGYIYLVEVGDGWYRIGRTGNVEQRFRSRRWEAKANKYPLVLLGLIKTNLADTDEIILHAKFKHCRTDERFNGMGPCLEKFKMSDRDLVLFWSWAAVMGIRAVKTRLDLSRDDWLNAVRTILDG